MATILIGIGFVALFFVLMSVRLIFLKDGKFKGTCASQNPFLNKEGATCGYCGKKVGEEDSACGREEEENPVHKVLNR
ncbi:MAG: hypothetical protein JJU28_06215 [Cyclobacteriaceae bacterium]|nr:hypothetical protein [Cyclobacteriaceae bacterium]